MYIIYLYYREIEQKMEVSAAHPYKLKEEMKNNNQNTLSEQF